MQRHGALRFFKWFKVAGERSVSDKDEASQGPGQERRKGKGRGFHPGAMRDMGS